MINRECKFITVLFSCEVCGLVDEPCTVAARRKEQDVRRWTEGVLIRAVSHRHQTLKFGCPAKKITAVKVPLPADDDPDPWVGKYTSTVPPKTEGGI